VIRNKCCPVGQMLKQNIQRANERVQEMESKGNVGGVHGSQMEAESLQEKLDKHISSCPMCEK